jgi:hypothetical protein
MCGRLRVGKSKLHVTLLTVGAFANYKEQVNDLLKRVTRVSVETVRIINLMGEAKR